MMHDHIPVLKMNKTDEERMLDKLLDARTDLSLARCQLQTMNSDEETHTEIMRMVMKIMEIQNMIDDMLINGKFKELYERFEKEVS